MLDLKKTLKEHRKIPKKNSKLMVFEPFTIYSVREFFISLLQVL